MQPSYWTSETGYQCRYPKHRGGVSPVPTIPAVTTCPTLRIGHKTRDVIGESTGQTRLLRNLGYRVHSSGYYMSWSSFRSSRSSKSSPEPARMGALKILRGDRIRHQCALDESVEPLTSNSASDVG